MGGAIGGVLTLEGLGNIGELIGGLAVIASLIYLAAQIRQNTKLLRTASRQDIVSGYRDHNRLFFEPGRSRTYAEGLKLPGDLREQLAEMLSEDPALPWDEALAELVEIEGEAQEQ